MPPPYPALPAIDPGACCHFANLIVLTVSLRCCAAVERNRCATDRDWLYAPHWMSVDATERRFAIPDEPAPYCLNSVWPSDALSTGFPCSDRAPWENANETVYASCCGSDCFYHFFSANAPTAKATCEPDPLSVCRDAATPTVRFERNAPPTEAWTAVSRCRASCVLYRVRCRHRPPLPARG